MNRTLYKFLEIVALVAVLQLDCMGVAEIKPSLKTLSDVLLTSPVSGQVIRFNGTKWVNVTLSSGSGDMLAATYDPTGIAASPFARANHTGAQAESTVTNLVSDLAAKVAANSAITGATKTKITYDAKGLVTAGADATTADISDSSNKRYTTDAQQTLLGNTSGNNTGDQTSVSGNAGTATALQIPRTINGTSFDGTGNITVSADAGTLTGATLASGVTASSLLSAAGGSFGTAAFTATGAYDASGAAAAAQAAAVQRANHTGTQTISTISDATTVGANLVKAINPSAISFPKVAADNTVSFRTPAQVLGDIGGIDGSALNASNLSSGTIPDARFPATLPAASGVNLTALNAANIASGTLAAARGGTGVSNTGTLTLGANLTTTGTSATTLAFPSSGTPTYTFPTTTAMIARTDSAQTFTGTQTFGNINFGNSTNNILNGNGAFINGVYLIVGYPGTNNTGVGLYVGSTLGLQYLDANTLQITNQTSGTYRDLTLRNATANGTLSVTGASTLTGGIVGTTAGGNATAGNVGEYVSASVVQGSATALTTATPKTVTSISLTSGDWDITAIGCSTGASTGTNFDLAIGTTTNSFTGTVLGDTRCETPTVSLTGADASLMIAAVRVTISSTTTYYLVVQETFSLGSPSAYGRISARRVR